MAETVDPSLTPPSWAISSSTSLRTSPSPSLTDTSATSAETTPLLTSTPIPPRTILKDFIHLNLNVSLIVPPPGTPPPTSNHPTTILFCAWMNASPRHIDYYTRTYRTFYPSTRILVLRISTVQFLFTRESTRRAQVAPAVSALLSFEAERGPENERLVIHEISNGGAKRAYGVAASYLQKSGRTLQSKVFLCDCAPGIPQFKRDIHALTLPFKKMNPVLAAPLYLLILISVTAVYVSVNWMPKWFWPELVWRPTKLFNDFGFCGREVLKGYVYSKEDLSIDWKDVEAHAKVAEDKGYRVMKKRVEGAEHALLWKGKGGEEDYWGWIRRLYEDGLEKREILNA